VFIALTKRFTTMEPWQSVTVRFHSRKNDSCICWFLKEGIMKDEGCMYRDCLKRRLSLILVIWKSPWTSKCLKRFLKILS